MRKSLPKLPPDVASAGAFVLRDVFAASEEEQLQVDREKKIFNAEEGEGARDQQPAAVAPKKGRHIHIHLGRGKT